MNLSAE